MRCVNHPEKQWAVTEFDECRMGLCQKCAEQWLPPLCRSCAPKRLALQKGKAVKELVYLALTFLLRGYFLVSSIIDIDIRKGGAVPKSTLKNNFSKQRKGELSPQQQQNKRQEVEELRKKPGL